MRIDDTSAPSSGRVREAIFSQCIMDKRLLPFKHVTCYLALWTILQLYVSQIPDREFSSGRLAIPVICMVSKYLITTSTEAPLDERYVMGDLSASKFENRLSVETAWWRPVL